MAAIRPTLITFFVLLLGAVSALSSRRKTSLPSDLSPEGQRALHLLLADLGIVSDGHAVELGVVEGHPSKEEFMPKCLAHTEQLVKTIDQEYTDEQLESVLVHDCELTREFPNSHKASFASHEACLEFAEKLTKCRHEELETGKDECYTTFCEDYYTHLSTEMQAAPEEESTRQTAPAPQVERAPAPQAETVSHPSPAPAPKKEEKKNSWDDQPNMNPASWFSSAHRGVSAGFVSIAVASGLMYTHIFLQ